VQDGVRRRWADAARRRCPTRKRERGGGPLEKKKSGTECTGFPSPATCAEVAKEEKGRFRDGRSALALKGHRPTASELSRGERGGEDVDRRGNCGGLSIGGIGGVKGTRDKKYLGQGGAKREQSHRHRGAGAPGGEIAWGKSGKRFEKTQESETKQKILEEIAHRKSVEYRRKKILLKENGARGASSCVCGIGPMCAGAIFTKHGNDSTGSHGGGKQLCD